MPDSTGRPGTTVGAFEDDDLLPLSGLQHLSCCGRQCALFHVEGLWLESQRTVEGRHLHEGVLAREPEHVQPHGNLGLCYAALGQRAKALEQIERALALDLDYEPAKHHKKIVSGLAEGERLDMSRFAQIEFFRDKFMEERQ